MTYLKSLLTCLSLLVIINVNAQQEKVKIDSSLLKGKASKSNLFSAECIGSRNEPSTDLKWRSVLTNKRIAHEPESKDYEKIKEIKDKKLKLKMENLYANTKENSNKNQSSVTPLVGANFLGNTNNGSSPMDNSIAISNGGWIVSVANTTIEYDQTDGTNTYFNDIASFIGDPSITNVCDPVVIYDPGADKFIFFAQECSGNSFNSFLLIFFSKTNNPNDGWWYYKITGNPQNDNSSFDYPKLAVSNNELYITGNLFVNGSFNKALLYQIDKSTGYNGSTLNWQYWYDLDGNPFTLCPVSYGQGDTYGPGIFLVATSSAGSSSVKLYDLTNDIGQSPGLNYYEIATDPYEPAATCPQLGTTCRLDNGDCRTLSGFYLDGKIHYVFHFDIGSGWNGINYNRLDLNSGVNTSTSFGLPGTYDYTYPSVVSFTNSPTDHSVMIGFGAVGADIYPEMRVVNCDNNMNWSASTLVKSGSGFSCYTNTTQERWGDYTGTARKHNSPSPSIWMNGMYGTTNNNWNTWISEIHGGIASSVEEDIQPSSELVLYPNPIVETFNLEFSLEKVTDLSIQIINSKGQLVKDLYQGKGYAGINVFSFNKANLAAGNYILTIHSSNKKIAHEKIVISH